MGGHVSGQVVPLSEVLVADGAGELLLPPPPHLGLRSELLLVVGAHVEDQVGGHAEGQVALGAPVLHRHAEGGEGGRQYGEGRGALQLRAPGPLLPRVVESIVQGDGRRHGLQVRSQQAGRHQAVVSHHSPGGEGRVAGGGGAAEVRLRLRRGCPFAGFAESAFLLALVVGQDQRKRAAAVVGGRPGALPCLRPRAVRNSLFGLRESVILTSQLIRFDLISFQLPSRGGCVSRRHQLRDVVIIRNVGFLQQHRFTHFRVKSLLVFPTLWGDFCVLSARFFVLQISGDVVEVRHPVLPLGLQVFVHINVAAPGVALHLCAQEPAVRQVGILVSEHLVAPSTFVGWKRREITRCNWMFLVITK